MEWYKIIIDMVIGLMTGILASIITNVIIERRVLSIDEHKKGLLDSYIFFKKMEVNFSSYTSDEINNKLVEYRILYVKDKELSSYFHKVNIEISNMVRLVSNGGNATFNFSGENYFNFITCLESRL